MASLTSTSEPIQTTPSRERSLLVGIGLCSFAALLLELSLTRLFSVVLFYHFAFLAISIALLGLGAGGVFAYVQRVRLARIETRALAARLCGLNAMVIPAVLVIILHVPVALRFSRGNFLRLTVLYLAAAVPFFLTGLVFSVVFARQARSITRLYGADLVGGALACLAVVPLLDRVGGPNTILFAGMMMAGATIAWAPTARGRRGPAILAGLLLLLIVANHSGRWIDVVYAKGRLRNKSLVEFARWNALSRVEVDQQGTHGKAIVIDADASTYIMNVDPGRWQGTDGAQDVCQQGRARRRAQDEVPAVADQPGGDRDQDPAQRGDHRLATAGAVAFDQLAALDEPGELVQPGGDGRGDQRGPHPRGVDLLMT